MTDKPDWDSQFAETESERNERLAARRKARLLFYDKQRRTVVSDSDPTKTGIFVLHRCWKCDDGARPCAQGQPNQCEFPRARND